MAPGFFFSFSFDQLYTHMLQKNYNSLERKIYISVEEIDALILVSFTAGL